MRLHLCALLCLLFGAPLTATGQLCSGSLGDAVLNESFDKNTLAIGYNDYKFVYGCPDNPGECTLTNFMFGCGPKTFYVTAGDHTRIISHNPNSNELLINATNKPGLVYRQTVDGLCGNITYQFSAFVTNMINTGVCSGSTVAVNLKFTITAPDGTVLGEYNTGAITQDGSVSWKQYGLFFTTPSVPTPVTLTITSTIAGGCGAVFAIDDITLKPCGTQVYVTLDNDTTNVKDLCAGYNDPLVLKATYLGFTKPKTIWQQSFDKGDTWADIPGADKDTYKAPHLTGDTTVLYRIIVAEDVNFNSPKCRIASTPVWIVTHSAPAAVPMAEVSGCLDKTLTMPLIQGGSNFVWDGPNGYSSISMQAVVPHITDADTGIYHVLAINDFGCTVLDSVHVTVRPSVTLNVTTKYAVCEGQTIQFDASGGGTYLWTPATGLSNTAIANPTLVVTDSAKYQVLIENTYGCKDSALVDVYVYRKTVANAGPDKYVIEGDTTILNATVKGTALQFYWTPTDYINNPQAINPAVNPPLGQIVYTLHANSAQGCGNITDNVTVYVYHDIYIPNAFTPNGDGVNDVFRILPYDKYTVKRFIIYNRMGYPVFTTTNASAAWDGTRNGQQQPAGTYVYYAEMALPDGKVLIKKGTIILIR